MGGVIHYFYVQHGGQAAQALGANTEGIHFFEQLQTQLLRAGLGTTGLQLMDVDRVHQGFLGDQHGLLGGAADADAKHAWRAPASTHLGNLFQHPVHHGVGRVEHGELGFRF